MVCKKTSFKNYEHITQSWTKECNVSPIYLFFEFSFTKTEFYREEKLNTKQ